MPQLQSITLKRNEDRRLRAGHLWIFSNEVDTAKSPLRQYQPGEQVVVLDDKGKSLGVAYVNPHSLIFARIFNRSTQYVLDQSLFVHRLNIALSLRQRCFAQPYYRLVFGESDFLPGLVVDRFDDTVVVQLTTAGMEHVKEDIVAALDKVVKPSCIIFRNDSSIRELEGLEPYVETAKGETPAIVTLEENHTRFEFNPLSGQKTGWFYDHRMNRQRLCQYVNGLRVLDVFSYIGGWGVQAANAGAKAVVCVDSSQTALEQVQANAQLNHCQDTVSIIKDDAFTALKHLHEEKQQFDVVILDPPAFIKRKKDHKQGLSAYLRANQLAMQLLSKDGLLLSASCSYHLKSQELTDVIAKTARHLDRSAQIIEHGHQGPDHPVHPAIPETDYLKALLLRVTRI
ncbi:MAG: class I SAM-dependent rRNA methyltransferase [Gammaproteobacteria bacterium]|jgi:23S rRNA (cytosine1962-C5)-methyltransferase